ncbi:MAG TPA: hypothetical protein DEQ09_00645 [Bacteroidales bacterium]|nr:hypothetical protein [Bacteroidales bacterium]
MKEKGKYNNIEELFRAKLGQREYPVPDKFWPAFAKRLRFKEFMRFKPGSFNVYYIVVMVAAAAITVSVFINRKEEAPVKPPERIIDTSTILLDTAHVDTEHEKVKTTDIIQEEVSDNMHQTAVNDDRVKTGSSDESTSEGEGKFEDTEKTQIDRPERLPVDKIITAEPLVDPTPIAKFVPDRSEGCVPYSIHFKNLSHNYDSCIWEFDDGGISTEDNPVWMYDEEGKYEVRLVIFGGNGSRTVSSGTIIVHPTPEARFEVSKGNPYIPDEEIRFYNYSQNAVEWEWDFGDGNKSDEFEPVHFYDKPGSYTVTLKAISEYGCVDRMVITNAFGNNTCYIKFPNAFVPNEGGPTGGYYSARSDEQEQVFHPVHSGVTSYNLRIYSRKGLLVFKTDDIEIGWDGYYKGQKAEPGVYIWKARGFYKNGEPFVKGGDVTLLPKW